ncbi:MAG: hypothetical protein AB1476_02240 [Candidatus Hadarchaeota archaeon]
MRKEVRMLPWAGLATVVFVVAAVLGWQMSGPVAPAWNIVEVWDSKNPKLPMGLAGGVPAVAGFENVYILDYQIQRYNQNFGDNGQAWITDNDPVCVYEGGVDPVTIPYEVRFVMAAAAKVSAPGSAPYVMAYARKENTKISLTTSGEFTYSENSTDVMEYVFENSNYGGPNGWIRYNAVFDNNGNGWILRAGTSIDFSVTLWTWG